MSFSKFFKWLFWFGLLCFFIMIVALIGLVLGGLDRSELELKNDIFGEVYAKSGSMFMIVGFLLLIDVIGIVRRDWRNFSDFGKFGSVAGLFMTSFVGSYIYYYFLEVKNKKSSIG